MDRSHHQGFAAQAACFGTFAGKRRVSGTFRQGRRLPADSTWPPSGAGSGALERYGIRRPAAPWWIARSERLILQLFLQFSIILSGFLAPRNGSLERSDLWIRAGFCGFGLTTSGTTPGRLRIAQRTRAMTGWTERSLGAGR